MARGRILLLAGWTLAGCLEYSPHALPTDPSEQDLNARAIARLHAQPAADPAAPVRFAIVGDVHHSYEELERAVERLNAVDGLELVVQLGDLTHLGTVQEFRLAKERFDALRVPYVVTVGNHDLLGNGGEIYARMFGSRDVAFTYRGVRLVLLDTNSREHGFGAAVPRLRWLAGALGQPDGTLRPAPPQPALLFAHVPPSSSDFDPDLAPSYLAMLGDGGVVSAFYGHEHRFEAGAHARVPFWMADALDRRSFLLATVRDGAVTVERVTF